MLNNDTNARRELEISETSDIILKKMFGLAGKQAADDASGNYRDTTSLFCPGYSRYCLREHPIPSWAR